MQPFRSLASLMPIWAWASTAVAIPTTLSPAVNESRVLHARQVGYDTSCEVGDDRIVVQDLSGNQPQAFTILWDAVENDLCTAQGCNFGESKCVDATAYAEVCISAQGNFLRENRDDIIRSARGIFDRTVDTLNGPTDTQVGYIEYGTNLVDLQAVQGAYSGFGIRVQLEKRDKGTGMCGETVNTIAGAGATLPEVGSLFGLVAFFCNLGSEPSAMLQATG